MKHTVKLNCISVPVSSLQLQPQLCKVQAIFRQRLLQASKELSSQGSRLPQNQPSCGSQELNKMENESLQSGLGSSCWGGVPWGGVPWGGVPGRLQAEGAGMLPREAGPAVCRTSVTPGAAVLAAEEPPFPVDAGNLQYKPRPVNLLCRQPSCPERGGAEFSCLN